MKFENLRTICIGGMASLFACISAVAEEDDLPNCDEANGFGPPIHQFDLTAESGATHVPVGNKIKFIGPLADGDYLLIPSAPKKWVDKAVYRAVKDSLEDFLWVVVEVGAYDPPNHKVLKEHRYDMEMFCAGGKLDKIVLTESDHRGPAGQHGGAAHYR